MTLRFGTDGVRGHADELTDELVRALGQAATRTLGGGRMVIGMDTRESGPRLAHALADGVRADGAEIEFLGVVPTPAVALVSAREHVPGAVISASHNPYHDNGIKFFAAGGVKLTDAVESDLEHALDELLVGTAEDRQRSAPESNVVSSAERVDESRVALYVDAMVASLDSRRLDGLSVVLDCANGAASDVGPRVFRALGADVVVLHNEPDGRNINEACGSTHPADLQAAVVAHGAHLGLAFDGDADRVLAVDATGALVDGDHVIAICAVDLAERGRLADNAVVVTVMTNLGFRLAMDELGVEVVETKVGDRYVLEALDARSLSLGGEQSGHVIFRDLATTGDGVLTGVQLADIVVRTGRTLEDLATVMTRLPQVLQSVTLKDRTVDVAAAIADDVERVEMGLRPTGRVVVRPSGTEPVVRVMVEASDQGDAEAAVAELVAAVQRVAG